MRFWDSSAIVPLLVPERHSTEIGRYAQEDIVTFVWWGARVELTSAMARRERKGELSVGEAARLTVRADALLDAWRDVRPSDELRGLAQRFVRVHPLRAGDAFQLAAAWTACEARPANMEFVCLDDRLRRAAVMEGFRLLPP